MEFRAGDAHRLGESFCRHDFAELERMSRASADFSLHLSPDDLELLFFEIMESVGRTPLSFTKLSGEPIAGDRFEAGAFVVAPSFVDAVAAVPNDDVNELVERWFDRIGQDAGEPRPDVTADAIIAVSELVRLCRAAISQHLQVVYCWSL